MINCSITSNTQWETIQEDDQKLDTYYNMFAAYTNNHKTLNFQSNCWSRSKVSQVDLGCHGCDRRGQDFIQGRGRGGSGRRGWGQSLQ